MMDCVHFHTKALQGSMRVVYFVSGPHDEATKYTVARQRLVRSLMSIGSRVRKCAPTSRSNTTIIADVLAPIR